MLLQLFLLHYSVSPFQDWIWDQWKQISKNRSFISPLISNLKLKYWQCALTRIKSIVTDVCSAKYDKEAYDN